MGHLSSYREKGGNWDAVWKACDQKVRMEIN
jgi:hypothetical protein